MRDRMSEMNKTAPYTPPAGGAGGDRNRRDDDDAPPHGRSGNAAKPKKDKKAKDIDLEAGNEDGDENREFFEELSTIKDQIASIKTHIEQIEDLHQKALNVISEEQSQQNAKELERVMEKANKIINDVRNKLKAMEAENKKMASRPDAVSDSRIRASQHGAVTKKFLDVMMEYKDIQKKYQDKYKQRMQRQFLIVKPGATEQEIDKMMDGQTGPVFAQQIMNTGQRREAQRALQDIQDRHADILRLEQSIIELQQLFMDMSVLVAAQGEMLNQIEVHVTSAVQDTHAGNQELKKAVKLQKKARKKMCIIICCLILLCVGIALAVYFSKK